MRKSRSFSIQGMISIADCFEFKLRGHGGLLYFQDIWYCMRNFPECSLPGAADRTRSLAGQKENGRKQGEKIAKNPLQFRKNNGIIDYDNKIKAG